MKKILFTFRAKNGFGIEFVSADSISEAWVELKKVIEDDESVDDYELSGGIE